MTERRLLVAHIFYPSLIVAVPVISILVLALALQWVGPLFPGFFLDPNLLVSESWDEGWTGPKAGLDHRDEVLSFDGQPVSASQEIINLVRRTQSATVHRQAKVVLLASIMAFVPGGIWAIVSSVWYSVASA